MADTVVVTGVDPLLVATAEQILARARPGGGPAAWGVAADAGLPWIGVPEEAGGSGGTLPDAVAVLHAAGRHAAALPLAETMLAGWLLAEVGAQVPAGPAAVVPGTDADTLRLAGGRVVGTAHDVAWARDAEVVVALVEDGDAGPHVVALEPGACTVGEGHDLAGQPRDRLTAACSPLVCVPAPPGVDAEALFLRGGLARAAQLAGAVEAVTGLTLDHTAQRVQFGRPVAAFQAVQRHLVHLAQASALTGLAVRRAAVAAQAGPAGFEIRAAKLVCDDAAALAARAAHQAHGAIGLTREYRLHELTRRLHAWRGEFGTSRRLAGELGAACVAVPSVARLIADGSAAGGPA